MTFTNKERRTIEHALATAAAEYESVATTLEGDCPGTGTMRRTIETFRTYAREARELLERLERIESESRTSDRSESAR